MSGDLLFLAFAGFGAFIYVLSILKITKSCTEAADEQPEVVCPECEESLCLLDASYKPFALVCKNPECKLCWATEKGEVKNRQ